jgi:IclR family acetate operon transcriptional repressor
VLYLLDALIIESLEGSYGVRATSYAGTRAPYHATACGKVILAQFEPAGRQAIYAARALTAFTPSTITDLAVLEAQLEEVRRAGYALELEEYEDSAHCAAAPIFDGFGRIAGSIRLRASRTRSHRRRSRRRLL